MRFQFIAYRCELDYSSAICLQLTGKAHKHMLNAYSLIYDDYEIYNTHCSKTSPATRVCGRFSVSKPVERIAKMICMWLWCGFQLHNIVSCSDRHLFKNIAIILNRLRMPWFAGLNGFFCKENDFINDIKSTKTKQSKGCISKPSPTKKIQGEFPFRWRCNRVFGLWMFYVVILPTSSLYSQ